MRIEILGGRIIDPHQKTDIEQNIYLAGGRVLHVSKQPPQPNWHADRTINAQGMVICPGLIDLCARLRGSAFAYKATLESEITAATRSGITSLVCPPDTNYPPDELAFIEMLKHRTSQPNQPQVYPLGALTKKPQGESLTEMSKLHDAGCVGFAQLDTPVINNQVLYRAMQYAATFGFTIWLKPQDYYLAKDGLVHDGETATRLGLPTIPALAEIIAVQSILTLAQETGCRIHLCRISSRNSLPLIQAAKAAGVAVSCDVNIHHLHLTDMDVGYFNSYCHFTPPLRSQRDQTALSLGLQQGTIDAICSDHTPLEEDTKRLPFGETTAGASGVELLLPLTLKWAKEQNQSLVEALAFLTAKPAKILRINAYTHWLTVGSAPDLCIFDPSLEWQVTPQSLSSQGKNTPFLGAYLHGKACYTFIKGQAV